MKQTAVPLILLAAICVFAAFTSVAGPAVSGGPINPGDVAWMLCASGLVLLMTPGLSFFYGGMVRPKNVISTMLQSFISMGLISIVWYVVGFSLAYGDSVHGLIGNPLTFFMFRHVGGATHPTLSPTIPLVLFAFFQLKFAIITPALITGSFAERVRFNSYMLYLVLWTLLIYSPLAHWTWHPEGFLHRMGVLDFAGGTVVHMSAGFAAFAGAMMLGRRNGNGKKRATMLPANIPFVILGAAMLWFGWFGFNAGSALAANETAAMAFATTNTASASATLAWIFLDMARGRKPTAIGACVGAVVGLVAITPGAGYVSIGASVFIGAIAATISNTLVAVKTWTEIDDTLDVFPCHGVGGTVGMLLTAVFAKDVGLVYGHVTTFLHHLLALVIVAVFSFGGSYLLYLLTDLIIPLRVTPEQELVGLDISQHGESLTLLRAGVESR